MESWKFLGKKLPFYLPSIFFASIKAEAQSSKNWSKPLPPGMKIRRKENPTRGGKMMTRQLKSIAGLFRWKVAQVLRSTSTWRNWWQGLGERSADGGFLCIYRVSVWELQTKNEKRKVWNPMQMEVLCSANSTDISGMELVKPKSQRRSHCKHDFEHITLRLP